MASWSRRVGAPLGVAVRSMRRSPVSLALRLAMLLPLALPPLAFASALDSLIGAPASLDESLRAALLLVLAQAPLAAGVVAVSVGIGPPPDRQVLEMARLRTAAFGPRPLVTRSNPAANLARYDSRWRSSLR